MDARDYMQHDGVGLAGLVTTGEVTAVELLTAARDRADAVNPLINAICVWFDEYADQRAVGQLSGPFAGVPFLLKDLYQSLAGLPISDGCRALVGRKAAYTSTIVQRWLDAGVVVFGRTSTPELGSKGVTESALFGPTRNPWNLEPHARGILRWRRGRGRGGHRAGGRGQ